MVFCSSWRNMQRIHSARHIDGQLELIHEEILASLLALHIRWKLADLLPTVWNVERKDLRVLLLKFSQLDCLASLKY